MASIGTEPQNRCHAPNLSNHLPFLGSLGDEIGKTILTQSSQRKEYTPLRVEASLNIECIIKDYHLWRFEVNVSEVFIANKKRERGNALKVM